MAAGVGFVLGLVAVVLVQHAAAQKVHVVGDATGWKVPDTPTFYSDWAAKNKFAVGDSLTFNFPPSVHDVLEITKESFEACGSEDDALDNAITASPATVKLTKPGPHYFMCTVGRHCVGGQKLAVTVSAAAGGAAAAADAEAPSPKGASESNATAPSPAGHDDAAAPADHAKSPSSSSATGSGGPASEELAPAPSSSSAVMGSIFVTLSAIVMSLF